MIHSYNFAKENIKDTGTVAEVKDTLVKITGFKSGVIGEAVTFENGIHGRIISIFPNSCEVMVFDKEPMAVGISVARTGGPVTVSVGEGLLTHVISPLGYVLDERRQESTTPEARNIDFKPIGIAGRVKVNKFLSTGVAIVDLMVPIADGQRELIIGDRKSGKTYFLLQTIISQARAGKICIVSLIGKRKSEIKKTEEILEQEGVIDKCILVVSSSSDSSGEIFLTPYTAMAVAEYFRDCGRDTIVILDDMTTHAKYYRELSLLAGRFPGRESYPGDIFHVQSQIVERAGNFRVNSKEVSITLLPVAETLEADLTGYIQTNLMSMTDGHIFFDSNLFFKGIRPAVNIFLSVTRVGRQTQSKEHKQAASEVLKILKKKEELERFLRFGPEVTNEVKEIVAKGDAIWEFFRQSDFKPFTSSEQLKKISEILK
ncbi:MAG TPA: F0F1 ATP synthase subunit alpha [Alphaproteobacteria bacterium]|jgi:F-type H+-transporting ATPase subunit alpha|nr:F0F1 ATP synthase subunit alpha [Alphaproteobacteria bacterium]